MALVGVIATEREELRQNRNMPAFLVRMIRKRLTYGSGRTRRQNQQTFRKPDNSELGIDTERIP